MANTLIKKIILLRIKIHLKKKKNGKGEVKKFSREGDKKS